MMTTEIKKTKRETLIFAHSQTFDRYMTKFVRAYRKVIDFDKRVELLNQFNIQSFEWEDGTLQIDDNRNALVEACIEGWSLRNHLQEEIGWVTADYILFFDIDMIHPPFTALQLIDTMKKHNLDVVSGVYYSKKAPHEPIHGIYGYPWWTRGLSIRKYHQYSAEERGQLAMHHRVMFKPPSRIYQVDVVGVGCLLVRTSVFKKLGYPWFKYLERSLDANNDPIPEDMLMRRKLTEDMYFCALCKEHGINIYVDEAVQCKHIKEEEIGEDHFKASLDIMLKEADPAKAKKYYVLRQLMQERYGDAWDKAKSSPNIDPANGGTRKDESAIIRFKPEEEKSDRADSAA